MDQLFLGFLSIQPTQLHTQLRTQFHTQIIFLRSPLRVTRIRLATRTQEADTRIQHTHTRGQLDPGILQWFQMHHFFRVRTY